MLEKAYTEWLQNGGHLKKSNNYDVFVAGYNAGLREGKETQYSISFNGEIAPISFSSYKEAESIINAIKADCAGNYKIVEVIK